MNNLDKMYDYYSKVDKEGWEELKIVKNHIKGNIYDTFSYEDNIGMFEDMDGKQLIPWYEKMEFSNIVSSEFHGSYERCTYNEPSKNRKYKEYKNKVKKEFVQVMDSKYNTLQL